MKLDVNERVIAESHARLDAARVPSCHGACCTDPTCNTRLGHRIKLLAAERDMLRASLREVVQAMREYGMDAEGPAPDRHLVMMARAERLLEDYRNDT